MNATELRERAESDFAEIYATGLADGLPPLSDAEQTVFKALLASTILETLPEDEKLDIIDELAERAASTIFGYDEDSDWDDPDFWSEYDD